MRHWPDKDQALLNEFLGQLGYAPHNLWGYRSMLRQFERFVTNRSGSVNVPTVRAWVRASAAGTSRQYMIQRAVFVNRFLDWLVQRGMVPGNPFAELRARYGCNSTSAIVGALLQRDWASALEALRPPSRYASHLGAVMREHVERMRSLGMRYSHADQFVRFDFFLQQRPGAAKESYETLSREYVSSASSPATRLARLRASALTRSYPPVLGKTDPPQLT